jgi:hypothetical protein
MNFLRPIVQPNLDYTDSDTITVVYKLKANDTDCHKPKLEYLEIRYNGDFINKKSSGFSTLFYKK